MTRTLRHVLTIGLLASGLMVPASVSAVADTSGPRVYFVAVGGEGPGDLVGATAYGFDAGVDTTVTMSNGGAPVPVTTVTADSEGTVALPAGTRVPLSTPPSDVDFYRLTFTQPGGLTATSWEFEVRTPHLWIESLQPGRPADLARAGQSITVVGLANSPDVTRSVTIDGRPVAVDWFSDTRTFSRPGVSFAVPTDIALGTHQVTFTQTGPTPYSVTRTVDVATPNVAVPSNVGTHMPVPMSVTGTAWDDDLDVTIVGAAGDRHTGMRWTTTHDANGVVTSTRSVTASGALSAGPATVSVASRVTGAKGSTQVTVDAATLSASQVLGSGARLSSPDGATLLLMQNDGNLVNFHGPDAFWTSRTAGHDGARLTLQTDGNLVIRDPAGRALWSSGTAGGGSGAHLGFDATDTPVLTMANGRKAWSTFQPGGHPVVAGSLHAGEYLFQGQKLSNSATAEKPFSVTLRLQTDGNLVLDAYASANVWSSRTAGHPGAYLVLQTDGNLVLRGANGSTVWANGVHGVSGARLIPQYNGDLGEFAPDGRLLWHTRTPGHYPS